MLNLDIHEMIHSRDVIWLGKYHKDLIVKKSSITESTNNDDDELNIQVGNQAVQKVVHTRMKRKISKREDIGR